MECIEGGKTEGLGEIEGRLDKGGRGGSPLQHGIEKGLIKFNFLIALVIERFGNYFQF